MDKRTLFWMHSLSFAKHKHILTCHKVLLLKGIRNERLVHFLMGQPISLASLPRQPDLGDTGLG